MNAVWQVQEAKNRFSELMDRAVSDGPQTVTRHGRAVVRVVAVTPEEAAVKPPVDDGFVQYLLNSPKVDGFELPVRRSKIAPPVLGR
jgi:antitoxin Phd